MKLLITLLLIVSFVTACGGSETSQNDLSSKLNTEDLVSTLTPELVSETAFKRPIDAQDATIIFSGSVFFDETPIISTISDTTYRGSGRKLSPAFSVTLLSDGASIIPVETRFIPTKTGIISTWANGNSYWDVIVGAGEVWEQADDNGWQRASFPISLVSRQGSRMKNCTATFLYNETQVSNTYLQCSQESSPPSPEGQIADMRALIPTQYFPEALSDAEQLLGQYRAEISNRIEIRDWSLLSSNPSFLKSLFNSQLRAAHELSLGALIVDDVIFRQVPLTRNGNYTYPNEMRYGVASVTKSALAALSLLYLEQRYNDSIFNAKISDYVPALAEHPAWGDASFSHALNMVIGTVSRDSSEYLGAFYQTATADDGISVIAQFASDGNNPGELFRYASTNTFVLSYAMQKFVESREGEAIYYWDLVKDNVLKPIGVNRLALQHTEELDGSQGIPIMGWGAYPTIDEIARIAKLFANDGQLDNVQLLHLERTRESMGKTTWEGYATSRGRRYRNGFWFIENANFAATCQTTLTYMAGNGGNYVGFLPSGMIFIRFTDGEYNDPTPMAVASERFSSSCQ